MRQEKKLFLIFQQLLLIRCQSDVWSTQQAGACVRTRWKKIPTSVAAAFPCKNQIVRKVRTEVSKPWEC